MATRKTDPKPAAKPAASVAAPAPAKVAAAVAKPAPAKKPDEAAQVIIGLLELVRAIHGQNSGLPLPGYIQIGKAEAYLAKHKG